MPSPYTYRGISSRAYADLNGGIVADRLGVPAGLRGSLLTFLHRGMGVMNFTCLGGEITYSVGPLPAGYHFAVRWPVSTVKANLVSTWLGELHQGQQPAPGATQWKQVVCTYLAGLLSSGAAVQVSYEPGDAQTGYGNLTAEITTEALTAAATQEDTGPPPQLPDLLPAPFLVPYELVAGVIGENLAAARAVYGQDHTALLALLLPLTGRELMADVLVGFTYHIYLKQPNRAYPFLRRAADNIRLLDRRVAKWVLDLVGSIEFQHLRWPEQAEATLVQSMTVGNEYALLKLAYLYLQQASAVNRKQAHELARYGELLLSVSQPDKGPSPHDADHSRAGYHIVASVYLWKIDLEAATRTHAPFLGDTDWCLRHRKLVEAYLLLAFALNDDDFINNLVLDYPIVRQEFALVLGAWQHNEQRPEAQGFSMAMIPYINQIRGARRRYYD
ncbi:hypothetical protein [Hymenobacter properus]|uniref:Uncharacterized protein n=1 Tax=Hymenobacter properus TaxID=2791026 RepID=A0A931FLQ9_9BACT|nr:hypothetical protein [Hymenobacter properus]MBF9144493.1 hypothetical protein [Hymenobacter properus]MBR7723311.1 hypothetical protein [Microvirga sp. SRT04]